MLKSVQKRRDTNNSPLEPSTASNGEHTPLLGAEDDRSRSREDEEEQDERVLKSIPDRIPTNSWLIIITEVCERCAYFGLSGPLQNYMQNRPDDPLLPGGLGLGQANASRINQSFAMFSYFAPIIGAVIADRYLGRLNTIVYSCVFYGLGLIALVISSLCVVSSRELSIVCLILSLALLAIGSGGIKPNVAPLIAEQHTGPEEKKKKTKSGASVILDKSMTISRMMAIFYMLNNVGSLSPVVTTELEQNFGFTSAFALPLLVFFVGFTILLSSRKRFISTPTEGPALSNAFKVIWIGLRNGSFESAKSTSALSSTNEISRTWDDTFVDEVSTTLQSCKLFIFYPIFFMAWLQMMSNFISQAGTMETHGLPNDILVNLCPMTVILLVPIFDRFLYPFFRNIGYPIRPITRIVIGYIFMALAMAYASLVQLLIYTSPPCYARPRSPDCLEGKYPNQIHVAIQTPAYLFVALGEIFMVPTSYELAVTKSPKSLKSLVMAVFMTTVAFGAMLAILVSPMAVDPWLGWMYGGISVVVFVTGCLIWVLFRGGDMQRIAHF